MCLPISLDTLRIEPYNLKVSLGQEASPVQGRRGRGALSPRSPGCTDRELTVNDTTRSDGERNVSEIDPVKEQARCRDWLAEHGHDGIDGRLARLGASDWLMEEILSAHQSTVKPISEWGPACATGFVRDSRFGSGQVIAGTNRNKSRANRRLVDWQGAK